jgi:hypothetical protein
MPSRREGLSFRIVRSLTHEHADTPHPLGLLAVNVAERQSLRGFAP